MLYLLYYTKALKDAKVMIVTEQFIVRRTFGTENDIKERKVHKRHTGEKTQ